MLQVDYSMVSPQPTAQLADAGVDRVNASDAGVEQGLGKASGRGTDIHSHEAGQVQPEGGYGVSQLDGAPQGLGLQHLDGCVGGYARLYVRYGRPVDQDLATGNEFFGFIDLWELFAHQRDEQAARMTFLFRQQQGSFWLGPNWGPSQREALGRCRRSWGRCGSRACPGARQQSRHAPAEPYWGYSELTERHRHYRRPSGAGGQAAGKAPTTLSAFTQIRAGTPAEAPRSGRPQQSRVRGRPRPLWRPPTHYRMLPSASRRKAPLFTSKSPSDN